MNVGKGSLVRTYTPSPIFRVIGRVRIVPRIKLESVIYVEMPRQSFFLFVCMSPGISGPEEVWWLCFLFENI